MDKKELIQKYNQGELKDTALFTITNVMSAVIVDINHGIDDKVFGYLQCGEERDFFNVKLKYLTDKIVFNVGKRRFDLDSFLRI